MVSSLSATPSNTTDGPGSFSQLAQVLPNSMQQNSKIYSLMNSGIEVHDIFNAFMASQAFWILCSSLFPEVLGLVLSDTQEVRLYKQPVSGREVLNPKIHSD